MRERASEPFPLCATLTENPMPVTEDKTCEEKWYTRPIFSVSNMDKSLHHYCDLLGFKQVWQYEENKITLVTQVSRGECELILAGNLDRIGTGRVLISLNDTEMEKIETEIEKKQITVERIHWGYPAIRLRDPDGNEMILPRESEN